MIGAFGPVQRIAESPNYKWWAYAAIAVGMFLTVMDQSGVNIALPRIAEHFDEKQSDRYAGYARGRFRQGKKAIGVADLAKIAGVRNRVFEDQAAFEKWVDAQEFPARTRQRVVVAVPATKRIAEDVVICMDAATGKTQWKTALPGEVTGRRSSSTASTSLTTQLMFRWARFVHAAR